ncbi:taste receptor type 2 member 3 [Rhynchocyon petersi]
MLGLTEWTFLVLSFAQFLLGLLVNGFIGLVNGSGWVRSKRISLSDFILAGLGLSRIVLLWVLLVDGVLFIFSPRDHEAGIIMKVIDIFWTVTNHLNIWLVTCLSVFYCLKIANFSHPAFLWLKWRVSRVVVQMLLGALFLSCGSSMYLIHEFKAQPTLSAVNDTGNEMGFVRKVTEYKKIHVTGALWYLPPLVVSLASYLLLIVSLGRHARQTQHLGAGSRDARTEAHKRALRIIFSFFLLFLFYFFAFLITSSSYFFSKTKLMLMTGETITMLYLMGHSFILILGNVRLRQQFGRLFWCQSRI